MSADGRTYTFSIRPGLRFSDGARVDTAGFTRAILRATVAGGPARHLVRDVLGMAAVDPDYPYLPEGVRAHGHRLVLRLRRPSADFLRRLVAPSMCAVPRGALREVRPAAGPYYVAQRYPTVILRANSHYRGPRAPKLDAIVVRPTYRRPGAVERVEQGAADWVPGRELELRQHSELTRRFGINRGRYRAGSIAALVYLRLNRMYYPAFAEPGVRRALAYAVDRVALARALGPGAGDPTDQTLLPQLVGFRDSAAYSLRGDPERARAAAGRLLELATTCELDCPLERALQRSLGASGIILRLRLCGIPEGCQDDVSLGRVAALHSDGADLLRDFVRSQTSVEPTANLRMVDNADARRGRSRRSALARLDERLARGPSYTIPLYVERDRHFFSSRVGCVRFDPIYGLDVAALCLR